MRAATRLDPRLGAIAEGSPDEVLARIDVLPSAAVLARSRTTDTSLVEIPGFGRVVRKRRRWPRAADRAKGAFRTTFAATSPARREHAALARLRALPSGPFAPEPLGWTEARNGAVLRACTLLVAEVPGAVDFAHFLRDERDTARRARVLADLARRTREMHAAGLLDRDHHPRNVLVAADRTWKVDCAKQRRRRAALGPAAATEDLAALDVGLVRLATPDERERFLADALGVPVTPALRARLDAARRAHERREARRLPPTRLPSDNER